MFAENNKSQGGAAIRASAVYSQFMDLKNCRNRGRSGIWQTTCDNAANGSLNLSIVEDIQINATRAEVRLIKSEVNVDRNLSLSTFASDPKRGFSYLSRSTSTTVLNKDRSLPAPLPPASVNPALPLVHREKPASVEQAATSYGAELEFTRFTTSRRGRFEPIEIQAPQMTQGFSDNNVDHNSLGFPCLLFRCQYESSGTNIHANGSLRAGMFFGGSYPPPPTGSLGFLEFAANHFQQLQMKSPFVSTSESLIETFHRAITKWERKNEETSIFCMSASELYGTAHVYHARPLMRTLRKKELVHPNKVRRYYGTMEHLIWQEISRSSILRRVCFAKIFAAAEAHPGLARLLRKTATGFTRSTSVKALRALYKTKEHRQVLDEEIASGIGKLFKLFGVVGASRDEVAHLVYCAIQGFAVNVPFEDDRLSVRILQAFLDGIEHNTRALREGFGMGVVYGKRELATEAEVL